MKLTIIGRPISKKNSKQIVSPGGRSFIIPSKAYAQFRIDVLKQLVGMKKIEPPYQMSYYFYMKGLLDSDMDNMIAGLNDILQEKGIITNDKYIMRYRNAVKIPGNADWKTNIYISHYEAHGSEQDCEKENRYDRRGKKYHEL